MLVDVIPFIPHQPVVAECISQEMPKCRVSKPLREESEVAFQLSALFPQPHLHTELRGHLSGGGCEQSCQDWSWGLKEAEGLPNTTESPDTEAKGLRYGRVAGMGETCPPWAWRIAC